MHPLTNGPVVDQHRQTSLPGFYAAGNVVHVHDLVDFVSEEAEIAGKFAALEAQGKLDNDTKFVTVTAEKGVRTCVPQCSICPKQENRYVCLCVWQAPNARLTGSKKRRKRSFAENAAGCQTQ